MNRRSVLWTLGALLGVASGCSKSEGAPTPAGAGAGPASAGQAKEAAGGSELTEIDLSSGDPIWTGWVAKGAKDAKVLADGIRGVRLAANGMNAFDIAFSPTKTSLKDSKKGVEFAAKSSEGKLKVTFLVDTPEKLEWKSDGYGTTSWNLVWNYKASGKAVSCSSNAAMGASSEAQLAQLKESCLSLRKK